MFDRYKKAAPSGAYESFFHAYEAMRWFKAETVGRLWDFAGMR